MPTVVTIKALATGVTSPSRTKKGRAYENTTLAAIAKAIAKHHDLTVVGTIRNIAIDRATQYMETDVGFLTRLGREYGYAFKVVGTKLVFTERADLRDAAAVLTIGVSDLRPGGRLRDKVKDIYQKVKASHHDPKTKKSVTYNSDGSETTATKVVTSKKKSSGQDTSGDTLRVSARTSNKGAAQVKAGAALDRANEERTAGSLPLVGDVRVVAGIVIALDTTFGKLAGNYLVESAHHQFARNGYTTDVEVKRSVPASTTGSAVVTGKVKAKGTKVIYNSDGTETAVASTKKK